MGLHQKHTHGHVFRGLEAREQLHIHRRDSHGNTPVMHIPPGFELQQKAGDNQNPPAVSVVYYTLPQTFSGPAVYRTLTGFPSPAPTVEAQPTQAPVVPSHNSPEHVSVSTSTAIAVPVAASETTSAPVMTSFATIASSSSLADINQMTDSTGGGSMIAGSPLQATSTSTPPQTIDQSSSSGMSSGAQAGLAFGIIFAIAVSAGLVYFCWRRQKKVRVEDEVNNEKHTSFADASARQVEAGAKRASVMTEKVPSSLRSSRTASTAPRLSLRPVTQFLPALPDNRSNTDVTGAGPFDKPQSSWERSPSNRDTNPFDDSPALSEKSLRPESPPQRNPFDEQAPVSARRSPKSSLDGSEPSTPRSVQGGPPGGPPLAGPGGNSPPRGPNNVHRVQLDFKPSMDDELELRSGQLVRMLHEYDDGWALCIRMDRSQQGVAPRTCLSKLPVKPRPQGPPPNGRPGTSRGPQGPPGPQLNGTMYPRPLTPTQANRDVSPTESTGSQPSAVPHRKPVPGQAM